MRTRHLAAAAVALLCLATGQAALHADPPHSRSAAPATAPAAAHRPAAAPASGVTKSTAVAPASAGSSQAAAAPNASAKSVKLVPFASPEAQTRLARSRYKVDFFRLTNHFETQQNMATCGPTSAVIVLNALRADTSSSDKPVDKALFPSTFRTQLPPGFEPVPPRYTQATFFDSRFEQVKPIATFYGAKGPDGKRDGGLQLRQLDAILRLHGLDTTLRIVDDAAKDNVIKAELKQNLRTDGDFVLINYARAALAQPGGGHISPLAAYDDASDSFLVLDVNSNKAPWVWVACKDLIAAMRTFDTVENRGYLLIKEGNASQSATAAQRPHVN